MFITHVYQPLWLQSQWLQHMHVSFDRRYLQGDSIMQGTLLNRNVAYLEHVWEEEQETRVHASTQAH